MNKWHSFLDEKLMGLRNKNKIKETEEMKKKNEKEKENVLLWYLKSL